MPSRAHSPCGARSARRGFTLLGVILLAALLAIAATATLSAGITLQRRAAEEDLLAIGLEFRNAFKSYYEAAVSTPRYPAKLEDLLRDPRFPNVRRHLRKLYADPLTGKTDWVIIPAPGGGIMGIHSKAGGTPIKIALFPPEIAAFEGKQSYAEWQFAYVAPELGGQAGNAAPGTSTTPSNANSSTSLFSTDPTSTDDRRN
jgi:type II secretory pathway pseudopilin PulG